MEALAVAVVGAFVAFAANALSPRGLRLTRDYFPGATQPSPLVLPGSASHGTNSGAEALAAAFQAEGLQLADRDQVVQLFHDPRYQQNLVVFIDARDADHYAAGHIPGAYEFDHYRPEESIGPVLAACMVAEQIVVYCNGGECEDSRFAAVTLRNAGVPREKLAVYAGGIAEWENHGLPVETGLRGSGQLRPPKS